MDADSDNNGYDSNNSSRGNIYYLIHGINGYKRL